MGNCAEQTGRKPQPNAQSFCSNKWKGLMKKQVLFHPSSPHNVVKSGWLKRRSVPQLPQSLLKRKMHLLFAVVIKSYLSNAVIVFQWVTFADLRNGLKIITPKAAKGDDTLQRDTRKSCWRTKPRSVTLNVPCALSWWFLHRCPP